MDIEALRSICIEECGLVAERPVVVGVSGGADSLCLMYALAELGYPLVVAHFDHRLREQSGEDAGLVQTLAGRLGLPFVLGSTDVAAMARTKHLSVEEAARKARYAFLFEQARQVGAQAVAVGHTADDQVETVLMHLLRGAGISGLKGMTFRGLLPEWDASIPLVRPLLNLRHEDALGCCEERGVVAVEDASNNDKSFFRNRLRHELLPLLESYNPQVRDSLLRMARGMAGDHEVLEAATADAWEQVQARSGAGYVSLDLAAFRGLLRGMQRRVLRTAVAQLRPDLRDVDFLSIERGVSFLNVPSRTREMDMLQNIHLLVDDKRAVLAETDALIVDENAPRMDTAQELLLDVPGTVSLQGWCISADYVDLDRVESLPDLGEDLSQAWMDASELSLPLRVRTRRPGDRFQPLGLDGHSLKLSDFLVNQRVPRWQRNNWPLVFSGPVLAWVPMFRPAHPYRLTGSTRRAVHLVLTREENPAAGE